MVYEEKILNPFLNQEEGGAPAPEEEKPEEEKPEEEKPEEGA